MAKRFKFRLERVLKYRQILQDERRRELLLKNQELREAEQQMEVLQGALARNGLRSGEMQAAELLMVGNYAARLKELIDWQRAKIEQLKQEAAQALERYIEATKDAEALKTLKAKRMEEYRQLVEKEEAKFLDELTTQRYNVEIFSDEI